MIILLTSAWGANAEVVYSGDEVATGDWATSKNISADCFADARTGDVIAVNVTECVSWDESYWQCILRFSSDGSNWSQPDVYDGSVTAVGKFYYVLTATDVTNLKAYGLNITGKYIKFNQVEILYKKTLWDTGLDGTNNNWATVSIGTLSDIESGSLLSVTVSSVDTDYSDDDRENAWHAYGLLYWNGSANVMTIETWNSGVGTNLYTLSSDQATALTGNEHSILARYLTVSELATYSATSPYILFSGSTATGDWSGDVAIANTTIAALSPAEGDILRVSVSDVNSDAEVHICKDYTDLANTAIHTSATYADFAITSDMLTAINGDACNIRVRGKNYTITEVRLIPQANYYKSLTITDTNKNIYAAGTFATVNITRSLLSGYNTITLPFAATAAELTGSEEAYLAELSGVNTESGTVLTFTKVDATEANKPYLIYVAEDVNVVAQEDMEVSALVDDWHNQTWSSTFCMQGNYTPALSVYQVNDKACYVVSGENSISPTGSSATLDGMRAYIYDNSSSSEVKAITFVVDDDPTGIKSLDQVSSTSAKKIYSLSGQQLAKPIKGINIVNGKKVIK